MKRLLQNLLFLTFCVSCNNPQNKKLERIYYQKNYNSIDSLMSVMNKIPLAKDTIFLGFRLGMTKNEYRNHIKKLQSEGKKIKYKKNLIVSSALKKFRIDGEYSDHLSYTDINLGDRYVYYTPIAMEYLDEEITGNAKCVLIPSYNEEDEMLALNILSTESWDKTFLSNHKWLKGNIAKKYPNSIFKRNDLNTVIGNVCSEILQGVIKNAYPASKTMMIVEPVTGTIEYRATKSLIADAIVELKIKELKKEEAKKTTF